MDLYSTSGWDIESTLGVLSMMSLAFHIAVLTVVFECLWTTVCVVHQHEEVA